MVLDTESDGGRAGGFDRRADEPCIGNKLRWYKAAFPRGRVEAVRDDGVGGLVRCKTSEGFAKDCADDRPCNANDEVKRLVRGPKECAPHFWTDVPTPKGGSQAT